MDLREQLKAELREEMQEELRAQRRIEAQTVANTKGLAETHTSTVKQPVYRQPLVSDEELASFDDPLPGSVRFATKPVYAHGVPVAWTASAEEAPLLGSPREGTNQTALARSQLDVLMQAAGPGLPTTSRPKPSPRSMRLYSDTKTIYEKKKNWWKI